MDEPLGECAQRGIVNQSPLSEALCYAYLNGIVQQAPGDPRPVHVPFALQPSPFSRQLVDHAQNVLCPGMLRLLNSVARDEVWLRTILAQPAADAARRGKDRMQRQLGLLGLDPQTAMMALSRADFMRADGQLKLVEINTISAAFTATAPRVQRMHRELLQRWPSETVQPQDVLLTNSDQQLASAFLKVRAHYEESTGQADTAIVFVVLEQEHLLCESLLEQAVRLHQPGLQLINLTLPGCSERLSLSSSTPPRLVLDDTTTVSVVYFRGGIYEACYSEAGWAARELIERSDAIKAPSIGCLLAGSKAVQAALVRPGALAEKMPTVPAEIHSQLLAGLTECWILGSVPAEIEAQAFEQPGEFILKQEQGIWVDEKLVSKLHELNEAEESNTDFILMRKIQGEPVSDVQFVREGEIIETGSGIQELGLYGTMLSDHQREVFVECAGYLVRTKPTHEADGGVCRGVAVLDSIALTDY